MLQELYVENFALIDKMRLQFSDGLTVLSGETGAGKSLVIDAVSLLIGARSNESFIRSGYNKCMIEGIFSGPFVDELIHVLQEVGIDTDEDILSLSRELQRSPAGGALKTIYRINGRMVPILVFRTVGRLLINIHGQMEHMLLLEEENQLYLLDSFGGEALLQKKVEVAKAFSKMETLKKSLSGLEESKQARTQKMDFLSYQIHEIDQAHLDPQEEESLCAEQIRLQNAETLIQASSAARKSLVADNAAMDKLAAGTSFLRQITSLDEKANFLFERMNAAYYELEDIAAELESYEESIAANSFRLEEVEQRIALMNQMKKKYGKTLQDVISYCQQASVQLAELEVLDLDSANLSEALREAQKEYQDEAASLTALRQKAAQKLSRAITEELVLLYMPQAVFEIALLPIEKSALGNEKALFMIRSNQGEKSLPVAKIASGGELSRIVLAMKVILSQLDRIATLVFDEVDSGMGGRSLNAVAQRMAFVGTMAQVLCVTHAPLMAAVAETHIYIYKEIVDKRTIIRYKTLNLDERIEELARMIAGDKVSEATLAQAKDMLKK